LPAVYIADVKATGFGFVLTSNGKIPWLCPRLASIKTIEEEIWRNTSPASRKLE
jgi:hypothetical protein